MRFRLPASGWAPLLAAAVLAACAAPSPHPNPRPAASSAHPAPAPNPAPAAEPRGDRGTDPSAETATGAEVGTPPAPAESAGAPIPEVGLASWYGGRFHGRRTASGERYDQRAFTAAHRSLPFHTRVRVRHLGNGREVVVRITDRGPHVKGRIIDLSRASAQALGVDGLAQVSLERLGP